MIQIVHYRQKCIGCNGCVEANSDRWRMSGKDGKSVLVGAKSKKGIYSINVENDEYQSVMKAIKNCPSKIIKVKKGH